MTDFILVFGSHSRDISVHTHPYDTHILTHIYQGLFLYTYTHPDIHSSRASDRTNRKGHSRVRVLILLNKF